MGPRSKKTSHYEAAFEDYLRHHGMPYVAVDEAKRSVFGTAKLKSFDFVVYRPSGHNLLVDVKGRRARPGQALASWIPRRDIDDLREWKDIFGDAFDAVYVFIYHWQGPSDKSVFADLFAYQENWYGMLAVGLTDYREAMQIRSESWGTVYIPAEPFKALVKPFDQLP